MPGRQAYTRASIFCDLRNIPEALEYVADVLDATDDKEQCEVCSRAVNGASAGTCRDEFLWAALLITDMADVPTENIRRLAAGIREGNRHAWP